MRDPFAQVLTEEGDASVDRILAATFFTCRRPDPGAPARVVVLAERRATRDRSRAAGGDSGG